MSLKKIFELSYNTVSKVPGFHKLLKWNILNPKIFMLRPLAGKLYADENGGAQQIPCQSGGLNPPPRCKIVTGKGNDKRKCE